MVKHLQMGSNGIKWDQMGSNGIKWDQMGSNGIKWDQMGHFSSCHSFAKWPKVHYGNSRNLRNQQPVNQWAHVKSVKSNQPKPTAASAFPLRPHLKLPHLCREIQAMQGSLLNCQKLFLWHSKWILVLRDMAVCQNPCSPGEHQNSW